MKSEILLPLAYVFFLFMKIQKKPIIFIAVDNSCRAVKIDSKEFKGKLLLFFCSPHKIVFAHFLAVYFPNNYKTTLCIKKK